MGVARGESVAILADGGELLPGKKRNLFGKLPWLLSQEASLAVGVRPLFFVAAGGSDVVSVNQSTYPMNSEIDAYRRDDRWRGDAKN
jgi:hypothetical protein